MRFVKMIILYGPHTNTYVVLKQMSFISSLYPCIFIMFIRSLVLDWLTDDVITELDVWKEIQWASERTWNQSDRESVRQRETLSCKRRNSETAGETQLPKSGHHFSATRDRRVQIFVEEVRREVRDLSEC